MAITNAQQYQQLVNPPMKGKKRPGYRGPGEYQSGKSKPSLGVSLHGGESVKDAVRRGELKAEAKRQERERQKLKQELLMTPVGRNRPLGPLSRFNANVQRNMNIKLAKKRADDLYSRLENYVVGDTDMDYDFSGAPVGLATLTSNKGTPLESTRPNLYTVNPKASVSALQTLLSATRPDTQVTLQNTLDKARDYTSLVNDAKNMTNQEIKDALTELQNRGKTPDQINPVRDDGPEPIIPVDTTFAETPVDEEDYYASVGGNPFTGEGLRLAFRADGGRIGLQEGGGIEQRLEKLGGDVSSAEKMLQGINQRLQTAESSLGSGGVGQDVTGNNPMIQPQPAGLGIFASRPIQLPGIQPGAIGPNIASSTPGVKPSIANIIATPRPGGLPFPDRGRPLLEPLTDKFIEGPAQPLATLEAADPFKNPAFEEMKPFGILPYDLSDPRGTRYNSIEAAFNSAQDNAKIMRMTGRIGPDILPGEMSFDDYKRFFTIDDEGFITNTTGADKFYEKDLTSDPNRFETSSYYDTFRNPDSPFFGKSGDSMMGIAKDRYVPLPTSGLISGLPSQRPLETKETRVIGVPAAGFADGGNVVGGEFDFESARQMYGLGKLVKKVTRTVKKIAKSPIGKAAIIGLGAYYAPGFGIKAKGGLAPFLQGAKTSIGNFFLGMPGDMGGRVAGTGLLSKIPGGGLTAALVGGSALAGLLTAKQEEEAQELSRGEGIDIEAARRSILARAQGNVAGDLRATAFLAEGGKPEPVAKKTMPLLDMGGQEMDLRAEGGFVPIGRMEKADDVPARLSKNEFVFTARKMFQTSQRLEEVL
jgi:hypothetical protein